MHSTHQPSSRGAAILGSLALIVAACGGGGTTATGSPDIDAPTATAGGAASPTAGGAASPTAGGAASPTAGNGGTLSGATFTVGSKEFTEQLILGQITIQVLESAGATVNSQTGLVGSTVVREALTSGQIDMYWEYTGTGWINHLGNTTPVAGTDEQFVAVRDADAANDIVWLDPAPLNNTYAIAVASETATSMGLTTLSDLAENAEGATLCAASEFLGRDDGLPGLQAAYGFEFSDVATVELGLIPNQIDSGETCVFGEVFATDSRIAAMDLLVLEDDLAFFPVYEPSLNVRQEVFDANPGLADLFAPIAAALDTVTMQRLNSQVDQEGKNEADVAAEFLQGLGITE
jgi:osmoprotectant transport system substrate-binding protein